MARVVALFLCLAGMDVLAQEPLAPPRAPQPKTIREDWQSATIDGQRAGYVVFTVQEYDVQGQKIFRATRRLQLTLKRFGDIAKVEAETGSDETPEGQVTGVFMRQGLGRGIELSVRGVVQGSQLHVTADGKMKFDKRIPWPSQTIGAYGEYLFVGKLKPSPGTEFEYMIYEPIVNTTVTVKAKAEAIEEVAIAGQKPRLLKVTAAPLQLEGAELPGSTFWYDYRYELIKTETIMPGLGKLVLERTTREDALRPCVGPDLGWRQSIQLKQKLDFTHDSQEVHYRLKLRDKSPETVFATDARQTVRPVSPGVVDMVVRAVRRPPEAATPDALPPGPEFTTSNYFITSDDPQVRRFATEAVGAEQDPFKKAQLIERWVHTRMKVMNFTEAMAPASEVAKSLTGDCTEYSMLSAAMCRAVGVPSKTALGLVYFDGRDGRNPVLAMHMWTEVWVRGQWIALDSTLGRGSIGPAHLKITDHSWHNVATMNPLMPLMRLQMSEPQVEIMKEQRAP